MTSISKIAAVALGALTLCLSARPLDAQELLPQLDQAQQVQRVRSLETPGQVASASAPSLYPGEEVDTGQQYILQLAQQPRWNWFNFSLDNQYFYTSNAFLSGTASGNAIRGTTLLVTTGDGEVDVPPILTPYGQLFTQLGYQYQRFWYGLGDAHNNVRRLDFDLATLYLQAQYDLPGQWSIGGNVSYNRLLDHSDFDEFYKEVVPTLSVEKIFNIRDNLQATLEYSGNYHETDEVPYPGYSRQANNRTDQALDFALTWQAAPKVIVRPFYRFQYSYYPGYFQSQSRNDFLHTLGISASYCFNQWSSIRVFLSYELRDSDAATVPDYRKFDAGGGVSLAFRF